jgi:hypothetical protein
MCLIDLTSEVGEHCMIPQKDYVTSVDRPVNLTWLIDLLVSLLMCTAWFGGGLYDLHGSSSESPTWFSNLVA